MCSRATDSPGRVKLSGLRSGRACPPSSLLKVGDFDLAQGTFLVHGKGGKVAVMPIAFDDPKDDLNLELLTRDPDEYLLHP